MIVVKLIGFDVNSDSRSVLTVTINQICAWLKREERIMVFTTFGNFELDPNDKSNQDAYAVWMRVNDRHAG